MKKRSFLACYQRWRSAHVRMLVQEDASIIRELIDLAPEDLHHFLRCYCDFELMLKHKAGAVFSHAIPIKLDFCVFKDIKHFKQQMQALQKAWSGLVKLKVETTFDERLQLHLTILEV